MEYRAFLESKIETAPVSGFDISADMLNKALKPHQRDAVGYLDAEEEKIEAQTLFDMLEE